MSAPPTFQVHYVGPSIVRCEPHDFCLEYWEEGVSLLFNGSEQRPSFAGSLDFPTPEKWNMQFPGLKGQRERIKSNIIAYASESTFTRFIAEFLQDEKRIADTERQLEVIRASVRLSSPQENAVLAANLASVRKIQNRSGGFNTFYIFFYVVLGVVIATITLLAG